ncbi:hypothetical protein HRF87_10225 [Bacillus sp. CRN 9]|nr:hypothetical protein [Bacillus sp. CRN 9]
MAKKATKEITVSVSVFSNTKAIIILKSNPPEIIIYDLGIGFKKILSLLEVGSVQKQGSRREAKELIHTLFMEGNTFKKIAERVARSKYSLRSKLHQVSLVHGMVQTTLLLPIVAPSDDVNVDAETLPAKPIVKTATRPSLIIHFFNVFTSNCMYL